MNIYDFLWKIFEAFCGFVLIASWITGVVIAKGFWSTTFACIIPFWSWYLIAERILTKFGYA